MYHEVLLADEDSLNDYARIMDARVVIYPDGTFKVRFACQVTGQNKVDFIYYDGLDKGGKLQTQKKKEEIPFLTFFDKKLHKLRVDISEDLQQAVLTGDGEYYLLSKERNETNMKEEYH